MKKIAALLLALTMVVSIASCGDKNNENTTGNVETTTNEVVAPKYTSALEVIETAWNAYPEDQKFFAAGGDYDHMVDNAPGKYNLDVENASNSLEYMTQFPESEFSKIDDAATLLHGMIANNFTAGAFHYTNASDVEAGIEAIKESYNNQHWMCGIPDKLVIFKVPGNYVISAYGLTDVIETFKNAVLNNVENAELVIEQATEAGGGDDWWDMGDGGIVLG